MGTIARRTPAQVKLFDQQPMKIGDGHFELSATSVRVIGEPSLDDWAFAFAWASSVAEASPYWIGKLLLYAEGRPDYQERLDQAIAATGLSEKTLRNAKWVVRSVPDENLAVAPSPSHAAIVAPLAPAEQRVWLERARDEGLDSRELTLEIRASRRRRIIEGQATLHGQYRVIYADPPWSYRDSSGRNRAEAKYPTMTIAELCALPVQLHAAKHSVLFLWVPTPLIWSEPGEPGPKEVAEAWGFRYKSMQTWDKVLGMPGRFFQVTTEHLMVCERGDCPPDVPVPKPKSLVTERRADEHSAKPGATRLMIQRMYTTGPYLELFARERTDGWEAFGNDARLWLPGGER